MYFKEFSLVYFAIAVLFCTSSALADKEATVEETAGANTAEVGSTSVGAGDANATKPVDGAAEVVGDGSTAEVKVVSTNKTEVNDPKEVNITTNDHDKTETNNSNNEFLAKIDKFIPTIKVEDIPVDKIFDKIIGSIEKAADYVEKIAKP